MVTVNELLKWSTSSTALNWIDQFFHCSPLLTCTGWHHQQHSVMYAVSSSQLWAHNSQQSFATQSESISQLGSGWVTWDVAEWYNNLGLAFSSLDMAFSNLDMAFSNLDMALGSLDVTFDCLGKTSYSLVVGSVSLGIHMGSMDVASQVRVWDFVTHGRRFEFWL